MSEEISIEDEILQAIEDLGVDARHSTPFSGPGYSITYEDDGIYLADDQGELVMWRDEEWIAEPQIVFSIARAIQILIEQGGMELRRTIKLE